MRSRRLLWSSGAGLLAIVVALTYFSRREAAITDLGRPVAIVVAVADIQAGTMLRPALLRQRTLPRQFAPPGALTSLEEAVGQIALTAIARGEPMTVTRLGQPNTEKALAPLLDARTRAITVPVSEVSGVAGLIHPHDRVDLLAGFDLGSREAAQSYVFTMLQGVEVMAVGRQLWGYGEAERKTAEKVQSTVTLAVTPQQAQQVVFALANGSLHLSLLPRGDFERAPHLAPATAASVTGMSSLVRRREYRGR